ncbi:hypothetical protein DY000_02020689 [Brassica cretica]|uniref:Uncharacterized protein n=1 Tax=Brassica cretica TaxID=69181 RepID=A0ABQ7EEB7_BRACR|nr:hypothetical protein DY000_02020689 [Brassica cretica]
MVTKQEIIGGGAAAPYASAYSSAENSVASTIKIKFKLDGVKSFQSNLDKLKAFGEQDDVMSGCSGSTCASVSSPYSEIIGGEAAAPCASTYSSAKTYVASSIKIKFKLDGVNSFPSNLDKLKAFGEQDDVMSGCSGSTCASVASAKTGLDGFSCARSSHASSSDCLQYPFHETVVLALRIYHPASVGGGICVVIKGTQVICIVASICADKLNIIHSIVTLAVEVSPVLTEEVAGVLVAENLAVDQRGVSVVFTKSMVRPESHQTVQTGHVGGTSDQGSVQGVYLYNQKDFQHETNFIGFYTQEGVQHNWNRAKIFTEQEVMNFTSQKFPSPSICEYPNLEEDSSSVKERPEAKPIIGVKRSLSAFQKVQDQEKWLRKLGDMINSTEPAKPTSSMESLQPFQLGSTQSYLWEPGDHLNQSGGDGDEAGVRSSVAERLLHMLPPIPQQKILLHQRVRDCVDPFLSDPFVHICT